MDTGAAEGSERCTALHDRGHFGKNADEDAGRIA